MVPSPTLSLVWMETSRITRAPRFSISSTRNTSLAIVTPSLVMTGVPPRTPMTTFQPLGPDAIFASSAIVSAPFSSFLTALSSRTTRRLLGFNRIGGSDRAQVIGRKRKPEPRTGSHNIAQDRTGFLFDCEHCRSFTWRNCNVELRPQPSRAAAPTGPLAVFLFSTGAQNADCVMPMASYCNEKYYG